MTTAKMQHDEDDEKQDSAPQVRGTPPGMKRIRLTRSIVLSGEHEEAGSIHDVMLPLAHRLIGEGSAEHHLEPGQKADPHPTTVNRMEDPSNRDPKSIRVSGPPTKVKPAGKEK